MAHTRDSEGVSAEPPQGPSCSVCDQPILRPQARQAYACSPTCMAELRRRSRARQYRRALEALEPRRRALQELPPEAFASLPERDRTILQLYYGLDGREPQSQRAIAAQLGLRQDLVSRVARTLTGRLLGWRILDPSGLLLVPCTVCGASIDRARPNTRKAHTCSPACQAELSRRQASAMQARRHTVAVESLRRQLEALPPAVFDILSERDRAILRGFCGLDGTAPSTTGVLAAQFQLTQMTIARIARLASKRLLADPHQARSAGSAVRLAQGN